MTKLDTMLALFDAITAENIRIEPVFANGQLLFEVWEFDDHGLQIAYKARGFALIEDGETIRVYRNLEDVVHYVTEWVLAGLGEPSDLAFI